MDKGVHGGLVGIAHRVWLVAIGGAWMDCDALASSVGNLRPMVATDHTCPACRDLNAETRRQ